MSLFISNILTLLPRNKHFPKSKNVKECGMKIVLNTLTCFSTKYGSISELLFIYINSAGKLRMMNQQQQKIKKTKRLHIHQCRRHHHHVHLFSIHKLFDSFKYDFYVEMLGVSINSHIFIQIQKSTFHIFLHIWNLIDFERQFSRDRDNRRQIGLL